MSYQSLKSKWNGKRVDYDKVFRYQCVDLIKQYAAEAFGAKPGAWGDAIDYAERPAASFLKIFERTTNPIQGDIVVFEGGRYGHIGLVDGISATAINTLEQNGSTGGGSGLAGDAIRTRWIPKSRVAAYYTPKDKSVNSPSLKSFQRMVGQHGVNYRDSPTLTARIRKEFKPGEILDFAGYVVGASYKGNKIWFKGKYSGGYSWSGSFLNKSTVGLKDITSKPNEPEPVVPDPIKPPSKPIPEPKPPVVTPPESNALALGTVVNKKNPLVPIDYAPNELRDVSGHKMELQAAAYMKMMINEALDQGVALITGSGYRSYETQEQVYQRWVDELGQEQADRESARPGHSEHQTGYTMDFAPIQSHFKDTPEYAWLQENAHRFGFLLRYPEGKEAITGYIFEPWHWRYVGLVDASAIKASGLTLEEYYGVEGGLYPGQDPIVVPPPVVEPPVVEPIPEPKPPKEPAAEVTLEGLRIAVLGVISLAITVLGQWVTSSVLGWTFLPENLTLEITGALTIFFRLADKYAYLYLKKIGVFAQGKWAKFVKRFKLPF